MSVKTEKGILSNEDFMMDLIYFGERFMVADKTIELSFQICIDADVKRIFKDNINQISKTYKIIQDAKDKGDFITDGELATLVTRVNEDKEDSLSSSSSDDEGTGTLTKNINSKL